MKHGDSRLRDENGSILVVAMMILVILTIIGIVATNMSTVELNIAGNELAYKKAFYAADAGVSLIVAVPPATLDPTSPPPIDSEFTYARRDLDNLDGDNDHSTGFDYQVFFKGVHSPGPPVEIEVQSDSLSNRGSVSIYAGVRIPTASGALGGTGDEGDFG